jgi:hypothetical protein
MARAVEENEALKQTLVTAEHGHVTQVAQLERELAGLREQARAVAALRQEDVATNNAVDDIMAMGICEDVNEILAQLRASGGDVDGAVERLLV